MRALIQRLGIERLPARNIVSGMKGSGAKPHNSQSTHYKLSFNNEAKNKIEKAGCHLPAFSNPL